MKHSLFPLLILLGSHIFITGCQTQQQQKQPESAAEKKEETPPPLYLGTVHQVFPADKFALVRIIGPRPAEGTVLVTHPQNGSAARVGNLIVSSAMHARNSIIAADIRAGMVMKGDRVYQYRNIAAAPIEKEVQESQETFTLHGDKIDMDFMPPEVRARRERNAALAAEAEKTQPTIQAPPTDSLSSTTEDSTEDDTPTMPAIPTPTGMPDIDSVPDDISGWDSM